MKKFVLMFVAAGLFVSGSAFGAAYSTSFEGADLTAALSGWDYLAGNWNQPELTTTNVYDGSQAILLSNRDIYRRAKMTYPVSNYGTLSVAIYDPGFDFLDGATVHGPHWGISAGGNDIGVGIDNRSFIDSDAGYAKSVGEPANASNALSSWWSPGWLGGLADTRNDADAAPAAGWTTWDITITAVDVTILGTDASGNTVGGTYALDASVLGATPDALTFYAGTGENPGIVVDAVSWTPVPEPASLSLLAIGSMMMIRRR